MEDQSKTKPGQNIDEAYFMDLMAKGTENKPPLPQTQEEPEVKPEKSSAKEKQKTKKNQDLSYRGRFLQHHNMSRRGEKSIYIRSEYHERLSRIVQVIGGDQIPLYAYLDNILEHHFELFEQAITEDYNNNHKPIF